MQRKAVEVSRLGKGPQRNGLRGDGAVLLDFQLQRAGMRLLQRERVPAPDPAPVAFQSVLSSLPVESFTRIVSTQLASSVER